MKRKLSSQKEKVEKTFFDVECEVEEGEDEEEYEDEDFIDDT